MWSLAGISMTMPLQPQSLMTFTSDGMQRAKPKISAFSPSAAMSEIAALSGAETAGMPASMRCTPSASSFLAIATFSSRRKTTAVCCSPSRRVTS